MDLGLRVAVPMHVQGSGIRDQGAWLQFLGAGFGNRAGFRDAAIVSSGCRVCGSGFSGF